MKISLLRATAAALVLLGPAAALANGPPLPRTYSAADCQELTAQLALKLGMAASYVLGKHEIDRHVIVGRDTRLSGDMLEAALNAGLAAMGGLVTLAYLRRYGIAKSRWDSPTPDGESPEAEWGFAPRLRAW